MDRPRGRSVSLSLLASSILVAVVAVGAGAETAPLTNEDVVRLLESGTPADLVIERIRSSEPAFDLSPEIVEELREARVPEAVLRAMRDRQAAAPSPTPSSPPERGASVRIRTEVRLELLRGGRRGGSIDRLSLPSTLDDAAAAKLGIRRPKEPPVVEDVAVFVACLTPEHVPDGWKDVSPLGSDFPAMPRHEMLAFSARSTEDASRDERAGRPPAGSVTLTLPASLSVDVVPDVEHRLYFGVAIRAAGRWRVLAEAPPLVAVVSAREAALLGTIRASRSNPFAPELALTTAATRSSTPPPPPS